MLTNRTIGRLLNAFRYTYTRRLNRVMNKLVRINGTRILTRTLRHIYHARYFLRVSFLRYLLRFQVTIIIRGRRHGSTSRTFIMGPLRRVLVVYTRLSVAFLGHRNLSLYLSFSACPT